MNSYSQIEISNLLHQYKAKKINRQKHEFTGTTIFFILVNYNLITGDYHYQLMNTTCKVLPTNQQTFIKFDDFIKSKTGNLDLLCFPETFETDEPE